MEKTRTIESGIAVAAGLVLMIMSLGLATEMPQATMISSLFLMPLIIAGVNQGLYRQNYSLTVIYNIGLLMFNDLLIRNYVDVSGLESQEVISRTFFVTLGLSIIPMLMHAEQRGKIRSKQRKIKVAVRCSVALTLASLTALSYYFFWLY